MFLNFFGDKMKKEETLAKNELLNNTIWVHFSSLQDARVQDNQRYEFKHLIIAIICGMICGANNVDSIVNYIESKIDWFREILGLEKPPSYSTIWWLLLLINPEELNKAFMSFVQDIRQGLGIEESKEKEAIAIDGKTSRGTGRKGIKALHTVSAWSSSIQLILGQVKTSEKSNEITAIPKLLELLDLNNKVISIDAMGCQSAIAKQIVEGGGDYILALKGNQETLHEEVKEAFNGLTKDIYDTKMSEAEEIEKGHGRIEKRRVKVSQNVEWLKKTKNWNSIKSIVEVESIRMIGAEKTQEKRYYISSLKEGAGNFLKWIRSHWGVESMHWTLDVAFKNDDFQGHTGNLAENFSALQRLTLVLLKQETSIKKSIPKKRERAGWNNEYLLKIIGV